MPFTILVVDDDLQFLGTISELLAGDGHRAVSAASGAEGLRLARTQRPDLILLDYYMPGMDGLAVLQQLQGDPTTRRIPVLALTAGTAEGANRLSQAGSIGFIPKPIEPAMFLRLVGTVLGATVARRPDSDSRRTS